MSRPTTEGVIDCNIWVSQSFVRWSFYPIFSVFLCMNNFVCNGRPAFECLDPVLCVLQCNIGLLWDQTWELTVFQTNHTHLEPMTHRPGLHLQWLWWECVCVCVVWACMCVWVCTGVLVLPPETAWAVSEMDSNTTTMSVIFISTTTMCRNGAGGWS